MNLYFLNRKYFSYKTCYENIHFSDKETIPIFLCSLRFLENVCMILCQCCAKLCNCLITVFLTCIIGAKLQDPCCYGHTQFHMVPDRFRRDKLIKKNLSEHIEVFLRANAIASLFAWTGAQAMYQGEFI